MFICCYLIIDYHFIFQSEIAELDDTKCDKINETDSNEENKNHPTNDSDETEATKSEIESTNCNGQYFLC